VALDFGDGVTNERVAFPGGADLEAWREATVQRNQIRDANLGNALAAVALVATIAGAGRHGLGPGRIIAATALAAMAAHEMSGQVDAAEQPPLFPDGHLLAVPFSVPPGLFTKKWIVVEAPPGLKCIISAVLEYETAEGHHERLLATLRDGGPSEWQPRACYTPGVADR
jgi:hypothetical protein